MEILRGAKSDFVGLDTGAASQYAETWLRVPRSYEYIGRDEASPCRIRPSTAPGGPLGGVTKG